MKHNQTRRDFIKYSTLLGTGLMLMPSCMAKTAPATGIQLYTLRKQMAEDVAGTLEKVAAIGYKEVELAGYRNGKFYGMKPSEFKKLLEDNGLRVPSGHYSTGRRNPDQKGTLTNQWEQAVEDAAAIGQEYMVCAYLAAPERKNLDDYKQTAELLNKSAEVAKAKGLQFCYHNHAFEFEKMEGEIPYNILLNETDKDLVKMELDLYWTAKAGIDPLQLFQEHSGRFPLWHVKDMDSEGKFAPVGTGQINFEEIFNHKKAAGMDHFFVEQDRIEGKPFDTVRLSYNNLQKILS